MTENKKIEANTERELKVLLKMFENIHQEILQSEKSEYDIPASFLGLSGIILVVANSSLFNVSSSNQAIIKFALYSVVLFIAVTGYHEYTMYSRKVAVLQGYAARLENQINDIVNSDSSIALRYSWYIEHFFVPEKFLTNTLSMLLMAPILGVSFLFISGIGFYQLRHSVGWLLGFGVVFLACLVGLVFIVWDNIQNDAARRLAGQMKVPFGRMKIK